MKITIWDLDYFDAASRTIVAPKTYFNTDAMKISGWHKKCGDQVNFVISNDDIYRPYDIYYLIKETKKSSTPPVDFYMNKKVRRTGAAWSGLKKWEISDDILGARPDYLLYPHYMDTKHPYAQIRLFNNKAKPLTTIQNWTNSMEEAVLVVDPVMWCASKNDIIQALKFLQTIKKVSFFEPIWLKKIIYDKDIINEFLKLNLFSVHKLRFTNVSINDFVAALDFIKQLRKYHPRIAKSISLYIDWYGNIEKHWTDKNAAIQDFEALKELIYMGKDEAIKLIIAPLKNRFDTPYFHLFEELYKWTSTNINWSWLEYLINTYQYQWDTLYTPNRWNEVFRDLLRQTWTDKKFLTYRNKIKPPISDNDIPWTVLEQEFKYGI